MCDEYSGVKVFGFLTGIMIGVGFFTVLAVLF